MKSLGGKLKPWKVIVWSQSPALGCNHRPSIPPSSLFSSSDTSTLFATIPHGVDPLYICMATDSFLR